MNIVITGAKGFLGKELARFFDKKHNVIPTDRTTLNPTNYEQVKKFFKKNKIDIVIHTAIKGGRRNHSENIEDFYENILMFNNLASQSQHYKLLFNFGSGAEFDRRGPITRVREESIELYTPIDYYGLSKNLITRKINYLHSNIFNLRLFGCFGKFEEPQRLLKSNFNNIKNDQNPIIFKDEFMDYFYAEDIGVVIEHIINNIESIKHRDINLCYKDKYKLSDLIDLLQNQLETSLGCTIKAEGIAHAYTGDSKILDSLGVKMLGLEKGLQKCVEGWKK
jgi:UDP-glucose 4-epimerase